MILLPAVGLQLSVLFFFEKLQLQEGGGERENLTLDYPGSALLDAK
jgi:hypothetical protein